MQLRSGAPGQQGGHLAQLIQEVLELEEEYKNVDRQREQIYDYRVNYLKKRPNKLIKFDSEDYYETPREAVGLLERFRGMGPAVRAEADAILADPDWIYLNESDERLRLELKRLFDSIGEKRQFIGYGKPRMRGGMLPGEANAPPPPSIPKPRRAGIPQPMNIGANGVALPLNARQQAVSDVLAYYALIIDPLWQSIQNMQVVGDGRVLDTQANRIIIHAFEVAVAERRAAVQQIMQADQDQDMIGNGRTHMERGRMWHDMCNRRY
jgi:hypothetical protein